MRHRFIVGLTGLFLITAMTRDGLDAQPEVLVAIASAFPPSIAVGQPTAVIVTIHLTDPLLIPESVALQRLDADGRVMAILGSLYDGGLNGDVTPGDQVYTIRQTFTEVAPAVILLRVSWALKGALGRAVSNMVSIEVG